MTCHLFRLPAELRNTIYEFAFTPTSKTTKQDLLKPTPPSPVLLLACRQVHNEAFAIYEQAKHAYWPTSTFSLISTSDDSPEQVYSAMSALYATDLAQVTSLDLTWKHDSSGDQTTSFTYKKGVWTTRSEISGTATGTIAGGTDFVIDGFDLDELEFSELVFLDELLPSDHADYDEVNSGWTVFKLELASGNPDVGDSPKTDGDKASRELVKIVERVEQRRLTLWELWGAWVFASPMHDSESDEESLDGGGWTRSERDADEFAEYERDLDFNDEDQDEGDDD